MYSNDIFSSFKKINKHKTAYLKNKDITLLTQVCSQSYGFSSSERVTGRKAKGLQTEEIGCKCQTFFISLLSCRRKQTTSVRFFSPSLYKFKKRFLLKCWICHGHTCFHLNLTFHNWTGFSSVTQSCPTLYDPMDCSMPGFPVHHQLLELTQTHVHWVSDAISRSEKVKFRWNQVLSWQHIILKRNLFLNLYREGGKNLTLVVCFLLQLKREIKNVWYLQPISSVWRPLAFLPITLSEPCQKWKESLKKEKDLECRK